MRVRSVDAAMTERAQHYAWANGWAGGASVSAESRQMPNHGRTRRPAPASIHPLRGGTALAFWDV